MDLTTIAIAAVCLLLGLAAGSLLTHTLSPNERKRRELEDKLRRKDDELKTYQRDVADHFVKTSELVREMNMRQLEISEQLVTGAMTLTSTDTSMRVQQLAFEGLNMDRKSALLSAVPPEQPKDYAPSVPGGILSESYGLTDFKDRDVTTRGLENQPGDGNEAAKDDPTLKIS